VKFVDLDGCNGCNGCGKSTLLAIVVNGARVARTGAWNQAGGTGKEATLRRESINLKSLFLPAPEPSLSPRKAGCDAQDPSRGGFSGWDR
jgi:hypothetical protein